MGIALLNPSYGAFDADASISNRRTIGRVQARRTIHQEDHSMRWPGPAL